MFEGNKTLYDMVPGAQIGSCSGEGDTLCTPEGHRKSMEPQYTRWLRKAWVEVYVARGWSSEEGDDGNLHFTHDKWGDLWVENIGWAKYGVKWDTVWRLPNGLIPVANFGTNCVGTKWTTRSSPREMYEMMKSCIDSDETYGLDWLLAQKRYGEHILECSQKVNLEPAIPIDPKIPLYYTEHDEPCFFVNSKGNPCRAPKSDAKWSTYREFEEFDYEEYAGDEDEGEADYDDVDAGWEEEE